MTCLLCCKREAVAVLRRMRGVVRPNLLTYNAALLALEQAGRWRQAARLVREMSRAKVKPTIISYNLALGACAKGGGGGGGNRGADIQVAPSGADSGGQVANAAPTSIAAPSEAAMRTRSTTSSADTCGPRRDVRATGLAC